MSNDKPITAELLKRQANRLKKQKGIPHHEALDEVAKRRQFANWRHFLNTQARGASAKKEAEIPAHGLICPQCSGSALFVRAVITEFGEAPIVSHKWLAVEEHFHKKSRSGIPQVWGADSDIKCTDCGFEGIASEFGFTGEDLRLNHSVATLGLIPPLRLLRASARLGKDGIILYSQENANIKDRPLTPQEVARQLRANSGMDEPIELFLATVKATGTAEFSQPREMHKFFTA